MQWKPLSRKLSNRRISLKRSFVLWGLTGEVSFQVIIKGGLFNKTNIKELISSCHKIVEHLKHSSKAIKVLRIAQEKLSLKPHRLIQDEPTRWNPHLHMVSRLTEQKKAIALVASDLNFQLDISSRQWVTIKGIIKITGLPT